MKLRITINIAGPTTLDALSPGAAAVIDAVSVVDGTVLRLQEMGLTTGAHVVVTRRAPLGDPLEISVRDTRVCMRREHARAFSVRPVTP